MNKLALLCGCLALLVGCQGPYDQPRPSLFSSEPPVPPPQMLRPDAAKAAFFRRIHYPYVTSKAQRRRIERIVRGLDVIQTPAQVLVALGPPDWKEYGDGYPPKLPPYEVWYYVHTLERPLGPDYEGKVLIIDVNKTTPPDLASFTNNGLQKVGR